MKEKTLDKIISMIRHCIDEDAIPTSSAPTNSTNPPGQTNIAGLPPDQPPGFKHKKRNAYLGVGSRSRWMQKRND